MKNFNGVDVYENLKEIIDPIHSCLVVWDVQNGLVDRIFNKEEFMSSLKPFIDILCGKIPLFYTLITPLPKKFASSWYLYSMMRRFNVDDANKLPSFMPPGSPERMIPEMIKPKKDDVQIQSRFDEWQQTRQHRVFLYPIFISLRVVINSSQHNVDPLLCSELTASLSICVYINRVRTEILVL